MNSNDERLDLSGQTFGRHDALCSPEAFADMCGVSFDTAVAWMHSGTVPSLKLEDAQLIDLDRIRADLEDGKDLFAEGDYDHD